MNLDTTSFIDGCKISSSHAYDLFKNLLDKLSDTSQRSDAIKILHEVVEFRIQNPNTELNFNVFQHQVLDEDGENVNLKFLQFPSTFLPESWSFTFYEGLIRYPFEQYANKFLVELGCGIGWIALSLALRFSPKKIFGLDINPKAITCSQLNLFLNGVDINNHELLLMNGQSLINTVEYRQSNLLNTFQHEDILFDKIIGCIPQVLNPNPEVMKTEISEKASDEYLQSLSNYFIEQGYIEDQFGLGLIASAVEQSIPLLKNDGSLILNLGGRPGRAVLENLMKRRGFQVRRIWQTQVQQAADTEIDALVEIEKNLGHHFEFYMSNSPDTPIEARTAKKYALAGGKIYHTVDVYEAKMLFPKQVKSIYETINRFSIGSNKNYLINLKNTIDLSIDDQEITEERIAFLDYLSNEIEGITHFPYQSTSGVPEFKQQISEFFKYYMHLTLDEEDIFIAPSRHDIYESLLLNHKPKLTLLSSALTSFIKRRFDTEDCEIIQIPNQIEYTIELIEKLKPNLVITKLNKYEIESTLLIEQLVEVTRKNNTLLVLDLTDYLDLSSKPKVLGIYKYLYNKSIPDHLILNAGLKNNKVYRDFSLNFSILNNKDILHGLVDAAEVTYSRTPIIKQMYYAHLLEQLLYFQRTRPGAQTTIPQVNKNTFHIPTSKTADLTFEHPAIKGNHLEFNENTIRLDYGENELNSPQFLIESIFESFLQKNLKEEKIPTKEVINEFIFQRFGIKSYSTENLILGDGVAPLFSALLNICQQENIQLIIPSGSYGYFRAAATYKNVDVIDMKTSQDKSFKICPLELEKELTKIPPHQKVWLFLNAPVVNPSGAIYSQKELDQIFAVANKFHLTIIMDTIFSGLEFDGEKTWKLESNLFTQDLPFILIGGISKEYASGGLRFGYAWSNNHRIAKQISLGIFNTPHITLQYAVINTMERQLKKDPQMILHLKKQQNELKSRAEKLARLLNSKGWHVLKPEGGLFLVAKPEKFIKEHKLSDIAGGDQMTKKLFDDLNIVINNSTWTGLPGYCRFVFSGNEKDFAEALNRMERYS